MEESFPLDLKEELSESGEKIGIEAELEEDTIQPFDPQEISIQQRNVAMDVIIRRLRQGSIQLAPSFQRKEVWNSTRKCRLIESLMLKIPLPMFYVAADEEGNWEVVDGLQRLSTIRDFIIGNKDGVRLQLKNLEFLGSKYDGKTFAAIENDINEQKLVNDIYETEMRFTVINPGTPEAVKRNIFKRINTGGMPLTSQEIRHALYEGKSSQLLQELTNSKEFLKTVGSKIDDSRMGASELILRLLSFMLIDRSFYKSGMDNWLSDTMRIINLFPNPKDIQLIKIFQNTEMPILKLQTIDEIKSKFELAMLRSAIIFDGHAFRKSLPGDTRKSPINKSLFEIWGNILSELSNESFVKLEINKELLLKEYALLFKDLEFNNAISRHSSSSKGVMDGFSRIKVLVEKIINGEES
ncbi:TPA: DUF262 domain-containing protein [Acinetobacter baumannii]|jgi:hypothetical protein|uniref:GmrSD restriction endonucleases N-terminal domain-containing protein n=5 Tax=Acinetobacter baumannii TaxID=470 RepID=A0ABX6CHK8_ACIB2|nr:DUF262 domain-containing protein [Acinetobacter baumannii]ARN30751.1 hypothetical protein A4U85_08475 [Acinetobacter baumannii]EEX04799.1 hypothetical protein HMPREF0010_00564 [Acinetobacter baumannii ATCC 19606 = CIP 70.34 = JCM 6841]EKV2267269.1 DUF262 domain-containing protein [Acinetobacter baumannii]EKV2802083.1 DUF262 domain-containing protein [Acinetobacter baumannii]EME56530.1 hypothetical protein G347_10541 [Acinetobacter baumannii MSP4-16]